jgi:hypothetical protein
VGPLALGIALALIEVAAYVGRIDELIMQTGVPQVNQIPCGVNCCMTLGLFQGCSNAEWCSRGQSRQGEQVVRHNATTAEVIVAWYVAHGFVVIRNVASALSPTRRECDSA